MCWFDCYFSFGSKKIVLSTSPYKKSTHWKQTIFYLEKPFKVDVHDQIKGILKVQKASDNMRELDVKLNFTHNEEEKPIQHYRISWWIHTNLLNITIIIHMKRNKPENVISENESMLVSDCRWANQSNPCQCLHKISILE